MRPRLILNRFGAAALWRIPSGDKLNTALAARRSALKKHGTAGHGLNGSHGTAFLW